MSIVDLSDVPKPELPDIYYDDACKDYWRQDASGYFMKVDMTSVRRRLKMDGFLPTPREGELVSEVDSALERIQTERRIFFAGSLAGHCLGVYENDGRKILVTDSPKIIEPVEGEWPIFRTFVENLLGDQQDFFWGWIKVAYEALRSGTQRPGQALVLAGPKNCGKSFLQMIITRILGDRVGHPYQFMVEATQFNAHLFGSEHLMIDDQAGSKSYARRTTFGQNLKGLINGQAQNYHAKHRTALSLKPFWRLTISVNDEPEHLAMLPMLDDSMSDKVIILKAEHHPMPMPTFGEEQREAFRATIYSELPHMLYDILNWDMPEEIRSQRFGVAHFHHPELLDAIRHISPEMQLLDLIDCTIFWTHSEASPCGPWVGRSQELESILVEGDYRVEARNVLNFSRAAGQFLAKLAEQVPDRVIKRRVKGVTRWKISPPEIASAEEWKNAE